MQSFSNRNRVTLQHPVVGGVRYTNLRVRPAEPEDLAGLKLETTLKPNLNAARLARHA
jgi:hypothetical protein